MKETIKNIPNILLNIAKNNFIFVVGIILLIYKGLLLNYSIGLQINTSMVMYTILVAVLIMCPTINKRNKFGYIYLNIIYFIITFILYADFLYYSYSTNFLSFCQIENIKYSREIASGVSCIISIKSMLIFFIDNILVIALSILGYKKIKSTEYSNKILKIALIVIIIILNVFIVKNKINDIYISKGYNKSLIVENASIYYYHYEDAKDYLSSIFRKEEIDEEKLKNVYEENINSKENTTEYTGTAKDSNVIILQLESLNEFIIGKKVNGKEITPNLNKFFRENIYCSNMYNQGLGSTADSEFEMENSMYPLENGYVFQKYSNNTWLDIYTILKENGYYTSFMHPNTSTFWNREEVYKAGYNIDEYNDISRFPNIEQAGEFYSDEGFFEEAVKIMNSYERKFCTTLVSVTTHIPFYLTRVSNLEEKVTITQEDVSMYENETFRNYIISCNFVDYAFGKFIEDLEETGLMENSILIVYGDHGASLTATDDLIKLYEENEIEYTDFENTTKDVHVPFGIKIPNVEGAKTVENAVAKIDIKPTILDLLNVEDKFSIGSSIFTSKDYAFIKGLGFITSKNYCINGKYYNREEKEIEATEELEKLLHKMENEIYLSDTIIKNNLINLNE
jgi:lipoteichoic acid synthase